LYSFVEEQVADKNKKAPSLLSRQEQQLKNKE
jgi:hypothetical protein